MDRHIPWPLQNFVGNQPYMAHTGVVRSLKDGEEHIVRAGHVADLYGVPKKLCHMVDNVDELRGWTDYQLAMLIHLVPREDGDYSEIPPIGAVPNE